MSQTNVEELKKSKERVERVGEQKADVDAQVSGQHLYWCSCINIANS